MLPDFPPQAIARFRLSLARSHVAACYELPSHRRPFRWNWKHVAALPFVLLGMALDRAFARVGL